MSQLAPLLLRSLLISMVGLLVVAGGAYAHSRGDGDRHTQRPASRLVLETPSDGEASFVQSAKPSVAVTLDLQSVSVESGDPCEQGECDPAL